MPQLVNMQSGRTAECNGDDDALMRFNASMTYVLKETRAKVFSPVTLAMWAAAWLLGAVAGPFGTFEAMSFPLRVFFWFAIASLSVFAGYGARAVAALLVGYARPARFDLVAILSVTACLTPIILVFGSFIEGRFGAPVPPADHVALYVFVIAAPIFLLRRLIPGFEMQRYPFQNHENAPAEPPRLLRRLPPELRGDLIRLSGNGHYTEVVTAHGTTTLRLRLSDAIEETAPIRGHAIHRSHWVAEAAISDVKRENAHKITMVLRNQDTVPVSRKYRPRLEDAGLIG